MRDNNILYIRQSDISGVVKVGICGDIKERCSSAQTELANLIEYYKLYAFTNMPNEWKLENIEKKFSDYFDKYHYKQNPKQGMPQAREMYLDSVIDKSDDFAEWLKESYGVEYKAFEGDVEGLVEYVNKNPQSWIDQYESNEHDPDYVEEEEDDDSISEEEYDESSEEDNESSEEDDESSEEDNESSEDDKKEYEVNKPVVIDITNLDVEEDDQIDKSKVDEKNNKKRLRENDVEKDDNKQQKINGWFSWFG